MFQNAAQLARDRERRLDPVVRESEVSLPQQDPVCGNTDDHTLRNNKKGLFAVSECSTTCAGS